MADLTKEEGEQLVEVLNRLKIKPKFDTAEELQNWLTSYGADPSVKTEPGEPVTTTVTAKIPHRPRISLFFGDNVKGEATYAQWVYEVKCLLIEKAHGPQVLAEAVRNSLRGEAKNLVRRLGYCPAIPEILEKFESVYGEVDTKEHLLAKFYSAKQDENEDVTKWSCRLEEILASAVERKMVEPSKINEMLRTMFWQGLKPSLKDISGYLFDKILDFDKLRVEIRKIEQDHLKTNCTAAPCKPLVDNTSDKSEIKQMKNMIQSLSESVQNLENKINTPQDLSYQDNPRPRFNKRRGTYQGNSGSYNVSRYQDPIRFNKPNYNQYPNQGQNQFKSHNQTQTQFQSPSQTRYPNQSHNQTQFRSQGRNPPQDQGDTFNRGPLCFRCRQYNHYQWQCPVGRMDHSRKYLN